MGKLHEIFKTFSRAILYMQRKKNESKKFQSTKKKVTFKFAI